MDYIHKNPEKFSSPPKIIDSGSRYIKITISEKDQNHHGRTRSNTLSTLNDDEDGDEPAQQITRRDNTAVKTRVRLILKDSFNYIPLKLEKFAKTFSLAEDKKGFFPYKGNCEFFYGKKLEKHLPLQFYEPERMGAKKREEFLKWYGEHHQQQYDFDRELEEYCRSDVNLLRKGFLEFRKMYMNITELDPIVNGCTIASYLMKVYKITLLEPDTISYIREKGYNAFQNQSGLALKYLSWLKEANQWPILQTKLSDEGEKKIDLGGGKFFLADGFIPPLDSSSKGTVIEIDGCHLHGCLKCFPVRQDIAINKKTHSMNHNLTMRKKMRLEKLGYKVVNHRTCDILAEIKEDKKKASEQQSGLSKFFKDNEDMHAHIDLREAFFGGRTEVFQCLKTAVKGTRIKYLDVCSLYPYVCRSKSYMLGEPEIIRENFDYPDARQHVKYKGFVRCTVLPPTDVRPAVLPMRCNGKLYFACCKACAQVENQDGQCTHTDEKRRFTGTWSHFELNHALEKGYQIQKIHEVWEWKRWSNDLGESSLFQTYIDKFLKIKVEASGWPKLNMTDAEKTAYVVDYERHSGIKLDPSKICYNEGLRWLAKLSLNSHWGKFGQRSNVASSVYIETYEDFFKLVTDEALEVLSLNLYGSTFVARYRRKDYAVNDNESGNVAIAALTTSHARLELIKILEKVGPQAIYCDTDSCIFTEDENEPPLLNTGVYLGDLTDEVPEGKILEAVCGGCKAYGLKIEKANGTVEHSVKLRGITLNYENTAKFSFDELKRLVSQFIKKESVVPAVFSMNSLKKRKGGTIQTFEMQRTYKPVNGKGRIMDNGQVLPYGYRANSPL
ncbi:hypothetical protein L596_021151 [Steinernema carpocapsae]|uniref:DNA-directed DNA polymerase n=2 Tax=Steinernema carpocapsae TaxID=34508 RepID=A0A4U5MVW4_STECR|nr:hypothetical protein L596_021151 [Steinernema carpocapsae]